LEQGSENIPWQRKYCRSKASLDYIFVVYTMAVITITYASLIRIIYGTTTTTRVLGLEPRI
jgi:hypothetical protein